MANQRTIKDTVEIEGVGLQTGNKVKLRFKGSPANSGINFIRVDLPNKPLLNIQSMAFDNINSKERRTTLGAGPIEIQTTEHLMAALSGLSIDNIVIETDAAELPGLDGSAKVFLDLLKKAKVIEQASPKRFLKLTEAVWCGDKESLLVAIPDDDFKVSYTLSYDNAALAAQFFAVTMDEEKFQSEIASARTFCMEAEARELLTRGLGKGANYENTLVIGSEGPINNTFRFKNEPVRHKILDLIGDLYILGMHIKGHVVAIKSGHRLNMELVKRLREKEHVWER